MHVRCKGERGTIRLSLQRDRCIEMCTPAYIPTHMHVCCTLTYIHACMCWYIRDCLHAYIMTYMHAYVHACMHVFIHIHMHVGEYTPMSVYVDGVWHCARIATTARQVPHTDKQLLTHTQVCVRTMPLVLQYYSIV